MKTKKRNPKGSYPIFAFRISAEEKDRLNRMIDEAHAKREALREKKEGAATWKLRRNDVILEALWIGLAKLTGK